MSDRGNRRAKEHILQSTMTVTAHDEDVRSARSNHTDKLARNIAVPNERTTLDPALADRLAQCRQIFLVGTCFGVVGARIDSADGSLDDMEQYDAGAMLLR